MKATGFPLLLAIVSLLTGCATNPVSSSSAQSAPPSTSQKVDAATEFVRWAVQGNEAEVKGALKQGLSPDTVNSFGTTAAMAASARGHLGVLEILVQHGANLNLIDRDGLNALTFAISGHKTAAVRFLIENGADPNLKTFGDLPPLFLAINQNQTDVVEVLLQRGANPNFETDSGGALHAAIRQENLDIVQLLLKAHVSIDQKDPNGLTPLMEAAGSGQDKIVELLLKAGASPTLVDHKGRTALQYAEQKDHSIIAEQIRRSQESAKSDFQKTSPQ